MLSSVSSKSSIFRLKRCVVIALAVLVAAAFILAGCSGSSNSSNKTGGNQPPSATSAPSGNTSPGSVSFSKDVQPILQSRCVNCHGGQRTSQSLDMTSYQKLMTGSSNGPVIVPGDPVNSLLIRMVQQGKMPKNGPLLLPQQIQTLSNWIKAGALNN